MLKGGESIADLPPVRDFGESVVLRQQWAFQEKKYKRGLFGVV